MNHRCDVRTVPDVRQSFDTLTTDPEQVIEVPKIFPEDVPMRAVLRDPQLVEQLVEVPTIVSFSLLQQMMEQNVGIPVPGGGGRIESLVFKVFSQNRVQQLCFLLQNAFLSGFWSRSLIFPVQALKIFAQDRVHPLLRTFQLVVMKLRMGLVKGVCALCPKIQKSAKLGPHSGSELSADFSSSTPAAHVDHWVHGDDVWICIDSVHGPFWKRLLSDHVQWHPPWERH